MTHAPETTGVTERRESAGGDLVTVVSFVIAFVLFLAGMFLMGRSVSIAGAEAAVFAAGILVCGLAYAIPMHILRLFDGA